MEKIKYKLESFEGPLDLLLTLIQKNKVSIYDILIAEITAQYLEAIEGIEKSNLDNTSEFLVMASQLLYIKSRMLLPKKEPEEDEEDPGEELKQRLLEYQKYKEASQELRKNEFSTKYMFFRETEKIKFPIPEYDRKHNVTELLEAFDNIFKRKLREAQPEKRIFSRIVGREKVSIGDMTDKIQRVLRRKKRIRFESLFKESDTRPEMIATFLAVLEMVKLGKLFADYDDEKKYYILTTEKAND